MIEIHGDLFDPPKDVGAVCITTNGVTRERDGAAVMGRGVALQAMTKWPGIEYTLGRCIEGHGNKTQFPTFESKKQVWLDIPLALRDKVLMPFHLIALPVKHHWRKKADVKLVEESLERLADLAGAVKGKIALPRPGCGNGGLKWGDMRPLVERILNTDQFIVMEKFV